MRILSQRPPWSFPTASSRPGPVALMSLALAVAATPGALAQRDFSDVQIEATHVAGNVYMLTGRGGNIGASVGDDGILIVDDQFAPLAEKIRAALAELGEGKPKFVLNTHWHGDHVGGNAEFGRDGAIIAHTNVRKRMSTRQETAFGVRDPSPGEALPVITFDDRLSIHFNGEEIQVIHFPKGHTDGDSVIFFTGSNVVHMGDDFFAGRFPFVDLHTGGSVQGLIENVGRILDRLPANVKIIPGHGPLSDPSDLRTYAGMLKETSGIVRDRIRAGKSLEEIQQEGLPEKWAEWGAGFINTEKWLQINYDSLTND